MNDLKAPLQLLNFFLWLKTILNRYQPTFRFHEISAVRPFSGVEFL